MKYLTIALASCLLAGIARAELDLTPRYATYEVDGVTFPQLAFSDGKKQLTYAPPPGWQSSGSSTKLTLRPKDKTQAEASVSRLPLPEPMTFDDEGIKKLAALALATVPEGGSNVQVLEQTKGAVYIEGKETFLVTFSYTLHGDSFARSVMFMPRGEEQIRFQLVSHLADFKDLQKAFFGSHFSWQGL